MNGDRDCKEIREKWDIHLKIEEAWIISYTRLSNHSFAHLSTGLLHCGDSFWSSLFNSPIFLELAEQHTSLQRN